MLESNPNHVNGNFNLGIFYWQGRRDLDAARDQMSKVIDLTENDAQQHGALERAKLTLAADRGRDQGVEQPQRAQEARLSEP